MTLKEFRELTKNFDENKEIKLASFDDYGFFLLTKIVEVNDAINCIILDEESVD